MIITWQVQAGKNSIIKGKMTTPIEGYFPSGLDHAAVPVILPVPGTTLLTPSSSVYNMHFIQR
jgi:hypothetical protein